jgi:gamma-glutamyl-gamma-aminobutyrate hydrolase PuuD
MRKPLIGITVTPRYPHPRHSKYALPYDRLAHTYVESIQTAGGLPILLPTNLDAEEIKLLRSHLDGILLSGGGDIEAIRFDGKPSKTISDVSSARDEMEYALVRLSLETNWPLFGICRGMQVINAALGGTLYTDIPEQYDTKTAHNLPEEKGRDFPAHEVRIIEGTKLANIVEKKLLHVNSFHHQGVLKVAEGLVINATASDDLIEGLEIAEQRFLIGVQWHPECLQKSSEQRAIFKTFISAARGE